jgi:hypothetical protein
MHTGFSLLNVHKRDRLEDLRVGGKIVLNGY